MRALPKLLLLAVVLAVFALIAGCSQQQPQQLQQPIQPQIGDGGVQMPGVGVLSSIKWFGHASFMFSDKASGNRIYYVDPFELEGSSYEKADIVFITHAHYDHCDADAVMKVLKPTTVIVVPSGCREKLGVKAEFVNVVPDKSYDVKGFKFRTVPAYNAKSERLQFHPEGNGWVGYVFSLDGQAIYHAGDTDFIPEMRQLGMVDVAMLPMGGTYTMDVDEAIEAANAIAAGITVPMHYRALLGSKAAAAEEKFKAGVKNSRVVVLEQVA